jgi:peptide/nickel transport system permease protein
MGFVLNFIKRIGYALALLAAVLVFNFTLLHLAPGDPADVIAGEMGGATPEMMAQIRKDYGLDRPFHEQLWRYISGVALGNLGHSIYFDRPVTELILERLGPTILLVVTSLLLALIVGTILGVVAARRPDGWLSHTITVLALLGYALPVFWTGIMLVILFASMFPVFPVSGMSTIASGDTGLTYVLDVMHHMVLPVVTLSTIYLAFYSRLARASMLDVLGADYIRTARAKGLGETVVVFKHALRNAVLPVITFAGLQFSGLFSGAVLVETVFNWPGLGTLAFDSILRRDSPTLLGILFFSALIVVIANLVTDLIYRLVDPRIKTGAQA